MKISFDLTKSLEKNAASYFEKAKKSKKKLLGAKKTVEEMSKKLEKKQALDEKNKLTENIRKEHSQRKKFWFEKFKWFFTSQNSLVIAGKDASSNEDIIKKHVEKNDLIFHSQAPGSPFGVLKGSKTQRDKLEAATFIFSLSKAWSQGIASGEAFCVEPDQVSKSAQSGEYISKGSFMVHGKREIFKVSLDLWVGIYNYEDVNLVMFGPETAIKANCEKFFKIKQGNIKKSEFSKVLMDKLNFPVNEPILSGLPGGKFSLNR